MSNSELIALREQILGDVVPLVLESADSGSDRFTLLLRIIQAGNANGDIYKRAYESAKKIEDADGRLEALLALLDEIDFDAARQEPEPVAPTEAVASQSVESRESNAPIGSTM
jgi:hypothetical protein